MAIRIQPAANDENDKVVRIAPSSGTSEVYIVHTGPDKGGGGDDGWRQSVETRLSQLHNDIAGMRLDLNDRNGKILDRLDKIWRKQEADFRLIMGIAISGALGIIGLIARVEGWLS